MCCILQTSVSLEEQMWWVLRKDNSFRLWDPLPKEKQLLLPRLEADDAKRNPERAPWVSWADIGRDLTRTLSDMPRTPVFLKPLQLLAASLRRCGWTRKAADHALGVDIPFRLWNTSLTVAPSRDKLPSRDNGRLGFRKLASGAVGDILEAHSAPTSRMVLGRGRKRAFNDAGELLAKPALALSGSRRGIYNASEAAWSKVHRTTFLRMLKTDFWWVAAVPRKLDVCDRCCQWDRQVCRLATESIHDWRRSLVSVWPDYFRRWDAAIQPTLSASDVSSVTLKYVDAFLCYVKGSSAWRESATDVAWAPGVRAELHQVEAAVIHELRTDWQRIAERTGLHDVVAMYAWHWGVVGRAKSCYKTDSDEPLAGHLYFHMDFKESERLPVGPIEAGCWWYAGSTLQVTVLTIAVWSDQDGGRKTMYTYCSDVLGHTCRFVVACLRHLLDTGLSLHHAVPHRKYVMWSDVGQHFRGAGSMAWWLHGLPSSSGALSTELKFFPEGHGKGICDGFFGQMSLWKQQAAKRVEIASIASYCAAMDAAAEAASAAVPGSRRCVFFNFEPPAFSDVPCPALDTAAMRAHGMGIKSSYMWSSEPVGGVWRLRAHRTTGHPVDASMPVILVPDAPDGTDWRRAYRLRKPEEEVATFATLKKSWERMRRAEVPLGSRFQSAEAKHDAVQRYRKRKSRFGRAETAAVWAKRAQCDAGDSSQTGPMRAIFPTILRCAGSRF